jgi:hypothetical protein
MPSSENYTIIWAGVYRRLTAAQNDRALQGDHPLIRAARKAGLAWWHDTFEIDPVEGDVSCLLVGQHLARLGYKEGQQRWRVSPEKCADVLRRVQARLKRAEIRGTAALYVMVHIEDEDDEE